MHMKGKWLQLAARLAPTYGSSLNSTHYHRTESLENFVKKSCLPHLVAWINAAGDTPLLSLLKNWNDFNDSSLRDAVNQMLISGAVIEMRDRNGDTALAVAARRGFRSTVDLLLEAGANFHARNYQRVGILKQVEEAMSLVVNDGRLWARKWSCYLVLGDALAISSPSDHDEWKSRYGRDSATPPQRVWQSHTVHKPPKGDPPSHWLG
jgi:ankyrin repeat protein